LTGRFALAAARDGTNPGSLPWLELKPSVPKLAARSRRLVIGLAEYVDLPEWRVLRLRAKVDTGARTSALHVENLRELPGGRVRFDVRLHRDRPERRITIEAPISRRGRVRSSSGWSEVRVFVATTLRIGNVALRAEFGLVDRARMIYRLLLGRTALGARFLVDPSQRYLLMEPSGARAAMPGSGLQRAGRGAP
jgi:hypothetical protein